MASPNLQYADLPYGPRMTRLLPALNKAFLWLNRWYVLPAARAGLAPLHATPLTGSWMILTTVGRKSGQPRPVPLGYAILDGAVYCTAGFGSTAQWFRNIQANPQVEVLLPGGAISGVAEEVTDPDEWLRGYRQLVIALGVIGRLTVTDPRTASDDELRRAAAGLPLVRIRPTGIGSGPFDPGGYGWVVPTTLTGLWLARALWRRRPWRVVRAACPCASCRRSAAEG